MYTFFFFSYLMTRTICAMLLVSHETPFLVLILLETVFHLLQHNVMCCFAEVVLAKSFVNMQPLPMVFLMNCFGCCCCLIMERYLLCQTVSCPFRWSCILYLFFLLWLVTWVHFMSLSSITLLRWIPLLHVIDFF